MTGLLRARIAEAFCAMLEGGPTLDRVLEELRDQFAPADAAFAQEMLYGTSRRYYSLSDRLDRTLARPLKARDLVLRALLLTGLNEVLYLATAPHAAVNESVEAARALGRDWACGLVNALLRGALRAPEPEASRTESARFEHPQWLVDRLRGDWPAHWQDILAGNLERAPLSLRANRSRSTRDACLAALATAGIPAIPLASAPDGFRLENPSDVRALPGFSAGNFIVQDEAAQLAVPLLDCRPGERILDACAAPGGKTAQLIGAAPGLTVTAVDTSHRRMTELHENLLRLGLACEEITADVRTWAKGASAAGRRFDRILLDAPCSAVGVIRRHPDIRLRRSPEDIQRSAALQSALLEALWPLLAEHGNLLYVTCSVLSAENDEVIADFLNRHPEAMPAALAVDWGVPTRHGRQTLPGVHGMDGFYFALLAHRGIPLCAAP